MVIHLLVSISDNCGGNMRQSSIDWFVSVIVAIIIMSLYAFIEWLENNQSSVWIYSLLFLGWFNAILNYSILKKIHNEN